jgi:hypothetical protein
VALGGNVERVVAGGERRDLARRGRIRAVDHAQSPTARGHVDEAPGQRDGAGQAGQLDGP